MRVYKGYIRLFCRNVHFMWIYLSIFLAVSIASTTMDSKSRDMDFQSAKMSIAVFDEDQSEFSKGIIKFLEERHYIEQLDHNKAAMQEALYYNTVDYILTIEQDAEEKYLNAGETLKAVRNPNSMSAAYIDTQLNNFLNGIKVYTKSGYGISESITMVMENEQENVQVNMLAQNSNGGKLPQYSYILRYIPYISVAVLCYCMGMVMVIFKKPEITRKMNASSVSVLSRNMQSVLAYLTLAAVLWMILILIPVVMYGKSFLEAPNLLLILLNTIAMVVMSLGFAILSGFATSSILGINGIANVLSLGMSFLGGVFVPVEMFGSGMKKAAQFIPTYWYENSNNLLNLYDTLTDSMKSEIMKGIGIQLLFAAASISIALAIGKYRQVERA